MIWIRVWSRSIPTESKDVHMERIQQRSKVPLLTRVTSQQQQVTSQLAASQQLTNPVVTEHSNDTTIWLYSVGN